MKIVINNCYGGFNISDKAFERLIELGWSLTTLDKKGQIVDKNADIYKSDQLILSEYAFCSLYHSDENLRTNKDIIKVVEELGEEANGICAKLKIIEIPDGVEWQIEEYDGMEWVAEKHNTWR